MKKENKSLILYTALIFLISIVMIIIAFIGQRNTQNMQPETDASGMTITEKVDQLSNENLNLFRRLDVLMQEKNILTKEKDLLYSFLNMICLIEEERFDEAKIIYDAIDPTSLTSMQKVYYDLITEKME